MAADDTSPVVGTEVQRIKGALDNLLTAATHPAIIALRAPGRGPVSTAQLSAEFMSKLDWSEPRRTADRLLDDPAGEALRQAVKVLGRRLYEIGGVQLMQEVCDQVAERDDANYCRRLAIMDHRFDGIGSWVA